MATIQLKRGSLATWNSLNPILLAGEPGFETDTNKLKIGNGSLSWNSLPYLVSGALRFRGTLGTGGTVSSLPLIYDSGWTFKIITAGTYAGHVCEIGDLIISTNDRTTGTGNDSDWTVVQDNLEGTFYAALEWTPNHTLADGTRYLVNDLVYSSGNLYRAKFDNESLPVTNTTYWENLGPGYRLNIDGRDIPNIAFPDILTPANNSLLTSDGTSTGINAEQTLTFDQNRLNINCDSGTPGLIIEADQRSSAIVSEVYGNPRSTETVEGDLLTLRDTSRLIFKGIRGTKSSPSGLVVGDTIFIIRGDAHNPHGTLNENETLESRSIRIRGSVSNNGTSYLGSSLTFETTSGSALWDNAMVFDNNGLLSINTVPVSLSGHTHGYNDITNFTTGVESVLSAGTKIHSLGAVSGNVSISYAIDKQIQTLTLNGTATNFIEGSGWPATNSVDVLLEITVSSTTSVTWTIVDDWYNPVPTLSTGKYLVLLRSMGTTIQGHYIGEKTN